MWLGIEQACPQRGFVVALVLMFAACTPPAPSPAPTAQPKPAASPTIAATARPAGGAPAAPTAAAKPAGVTTAPAPPAAGGAGGGSAPPRNRAEETFRFQTRLSTPEEIEEIADILKRQPGILDVFGDERSITIGYDPALRTPVQIREQLASARHPVQ